ncbi:MAG: hypothetical protein AAGE84_07980 [Cyanobacteria bacterium P01_G01_bin.39]
MSRDDLHQQEMQKFSFIESLNLSHQKSRQASVDRLDINSDEQHKSSCNQALAIKTKPEPQASELITTSSTINADWYQEDSSNFNLNWAEVINAAADNAVDHNQPQNHNYFGKILFALATSYGLFVLWWLFGHQISKTLTFLAGGKQTVLSQSEVQFIDYIERSLDQIDRQLEAKRKAAGSDDVVYVPVYTPTTPQMPQTLGANTTATALPSNSSSGVSPSPSSPTSALKIPAPPPLPAPTSLESNVPENSKIAVAKPKIKHTLIGILELGEDSAALVQVQGKTRRFLVGEEINTEGLILESVGSQRASISDNGQVRSIAVGETF